MADHSRSVAKLQSVRSGLQVDEPVARNPLEIFVGMLFFVWIAVPPVVLLTLAFLELAPISPSVAIALSVASSAAAFAAAWKFYRDENGTPFRAVVSFYKCAISGRHGHAYGMVIEADKDDTERQFDNETFRFDNVEGFRRYWEAVRAKGGNTGRVRIDSRNHVVFHAEDLARVTIAFVDEQGRRGADHHKLVVKIDHEWHLFNGEWSSREDDDISWLTGQGHE